MCFSLTPPSTPDFYTLSLHDALPILYDQRSAEMVFRPGPVFTQLLLADEINRDRKSTRLNSSHRCISYAVFCLKKKNKNNTQFKIYDTISQPRQYHNSSNIYYSVVYN